MQMQETNLSDVLDTIALEVALGKRYSDSRVDLAGLELLLNEDDTHLFGIDLENAG